MSELINTLRKELSSLEAELRADPKYVKVERIKALLAAYGDVAVEVVPGQLRQDTISAHRPLAPPFAAIRENSKATRARKVMRDHLQQHGTVHRDELLKVLKAQGVIGHEKEPMKQLGTYLSRYREFKSEGGGL